MNPKQRGGNADNLRRASIAVRNLIDQVPAGRGRWANWVPEELERQADALNGPNPQTNEEAS